MNLDTEILQAELALNLKKTLFKANRCTQSEIDQATDHLNTLRLAKQGYPSEQTAQTPITQAPKQAALEVLPLVGTSYQETQAALTKQAKQLSDEQAIASNQLVAAYQQDSKQNVYGLMQNALTLRRQVEDVWDKKKFLERNGYLPQEPQVPVQSSSEHLERFELQQKRKQIRDQILKLEKKIADPTKHVRFHKVEQKMIEWQKQLLIYREELDKISISII